jgi:RimJ/RimL family protein N-acetyltransferase
MTIAIGLRPTQRADLDFVLAAETSPENAPYVNQWSQTQHQAAIDDQSIAHYIIEPSTDQAPVGYTLLEGLHSSDRAVLLRRIVITEKGNGYGRKVMQLLKAQVFEGWQMHRFWLDVKDFNQRAFDLYQSEGFVVEGTLRECIKRGDRYESLILLSMLDREYFAARR